MRFRREHGGDLVKIDRLDEKVGRAEPGGGDSIRNVTIAAHDEETAARRPPPEVFGHGKS